MPPHAGSRRRELLRRRRRGCQLLLRHRALGTASTRKRSRCESRGKKQRREEASGGQESSLPDKLRFASFICEAEVAGLSL